MIELLKRLKQLIKPVLYRRYSLVMLERDIDDIEQPLKKPTRWDIRLLDHSDLEACRAYFSHQLAAFEQLFKDQFTCFGAIEHESKDVISVVWYAQTTYQDDFNRCTFHVADGEVFQFAGEVAPPFRHSQLANDALKVCWEYWRQKGIRKITCAVDVKNTPSLRLLFFMNWRESGKLVRYHRWLGKQITWEETYSGERFAHFKKKRGEP